MNSEKISKALDEAIERGFWNEIHSSSEGDVKISPLGGFTILLHDCNPKALCWLTFFTAQRAISSTDLDRYFRARFGLASRYLKASTNSEFLSKTLLHKMKLMHNLNLINQHLCQVRKIDWSKVTEPIPSPVNDCGSEWYDAEANAVLNCARYIHLKKTEFAIDCILDADRALENAENNFHTWFRQVALPAALRR